MRNSHLAPILLPQRESYFFFRPSRTRISLTSDYKDLPGLDDKEPPQLLETPIPQIYLWINDVRKVDFPCRLFMARNSMIISIYSY